jgi:type IV secretion system protein VirB6
VADTANALAMGVATTFLPTGADPATIATPYALLDKFNDEPEPVGARLAEGGRDHATRPGLRGRCLLDRFNVIFLCIALFVVTLAKVFLTFVIAVGPLFVLCLAWRPTARFFDSWLSMVLNAVVLTWFAFFALGLSAFMGDALCRPSGSGRLPRPYLQCRRRSLKYCVVMILMAIICFQAPSLASALTGGAAVQQGIQMIQNAMMVSGLRSASAGRGAGAAGAAGGVVRAVLAPYAAGQATGAAAAATGRARNHGRRCRRRGPPGLRRGAIPQPTPPHYAAERESSTS